MVGASKKARLEDEMKKAITALDESIKVLKEATEGAEVPEALVTAIANELAECEASTNSTLRSLMAMLAQHESPGLQGLVLAMDFGGFYRSAPSIGGT